MMVIMMLLMMMIMMMMITVVNNDYHDCDCDYIDFGFNNVLLSLELIKSFDRTSSIYAASLHQSKKFYVAGGEDFCLYKIDYDTGDVIG